MNNQFQFLIYNTPNDDVSVNAVVKDETVWLTQKAMAELFGCSAGNISLHLKNIYNDDELYQQLDINSPHKQLGNISLCL